MEKHTKHAIEDALPEPDREVLPGDVSDYQSRHELRMSAIIKTIAFFCGVLFLMTCLKAWQESHKPATVPPPRHMELPAGTK
jgi:hypothetical protein